MKCQKIRTSSKQNYLNTHFHKWTQLNDICDLIDKEAVQL